MVVVSPLEVESPTCIFLANSAKMPQCSFNTVSEGEMPPASATEMLILHFVSSVHNHLVWIVQLSHQSLDNSTLLSQAFQTGVWANENF